MKYVTSLKYKEACDIIWMCLYDTRLGHVSLFLENGQVISKRDNIDKDKCVAELLETGLWEEYNPFPEVTFTRPKDEGGISILSPDILKDIIEINVDKKN